MDSERHYEQMVMLVDSLKLAWQDREDHYVAGNMAVYYSETQAKRNDFKGPDVFVVLNAGKKERLSWVVWEEEGKTPDVVIELLSPTTEKADRGEKKRIYAQLLKVGHYYLFDPHTGDLEGYQLDLRDLAYRPLEPNDKGWLPCPPLDLWLGVIRGDYHGHELDWLRWIDDNGEVLPHSSELAQAVRAAEKRATKAEEELAELRARLAKLEGP